MGRPRFNGHLAVPMPGRIGAVRSSSPRRPQAFRGGTLLPPTQIRGGLYEQLLCLAIREGCEWVESGAQPFVRHLPAAREGAAGLYELAHHIQIIRRALVFLPYGRQCCTFVLPCLRGEPASASMAVTMA